MYDRAMVVFLDARINFQTLGFGYLLSIREIPPREATLQFLLVSKLYSTRENYVEYLIQKYTSIYSSMLHKCQARH